MKFWSFPSLLLPVFLLLFTPIHGQYRDGDVRLVGGSYQWEGRVEVYMSGVWGTITDSEWTDNDARVVCRKLGHFRAGATAYSNAYFGEGGGPVNLDSVQCSGSEYNLTECEIGNSGTRTTHSLDVGVKCQPANGLYRNGDLRLVGGPHNWEGRVEVYWNGTWGAINDSQWSTNEANVVCRQLKHSQESGAVIPCCGMYGVGSGAITMRDVVCSGTESRLINCVFSTEPGSVVNRRNNAQVQCKKGNETNEWDVRLVGGSYLWEGRVEIFLLGSWTTVYDYYNSHSAIVVCQQLGYNTYRLYCCRWFGEGTGLIKIRYLRCNSLDYRLSECGYSSYSGYSHSNDWGVVCSIDEPDDLEIQLGTGSGSSSGVLYMYLSGSWQPVANSLSTWKSNNSDVVCRELGYAPYSSPSSSWYSSSYSSSASTTIIDNVVCTGNESRLLDCSHSENYFPGSYPAVGVRCQTYACSNEDLRLIDGKTEAEGRVEVCDNYRWGTVCNRKWTPNITALVCKYFGFSEFIGESSSVMFGGGIGPVHIDYINCTGDFWRGCDHFTHPSGCSHDDDVGVQCQPARCSDGQLRLTDSSDERYGRIEICSDQRWKTFYYYQWIRYNALVACKELGFSSYSSYRTTYGFGGGPRHSKYFICTGSELRLSQCQSFNETTPRTANYDVGIGCRYADCTDGEMRLTEGKTEWEGRLEVCLSRRWGTVGGNEWTQTNSHVVCNALGYDITDEPANQSTPMAPSKPLHYHSIRCSRRDLTLLECGFTRSSPYDYAEIDKHAVVKCQEPVCEDGDIRLVGGASESEGRLEVCFDKRWGTIDGNGWTDTDTQVACKQLGFSTSGVSYTKAERRRYSTSQSLPASMTLVGCYGSEERLTDCAYHEFTTTSSMDISISCDMEEESAAQASTVAMASLSISIILALALIGVVAVLIAVLVLRRRKSSAKRDLPPHHPTHDPSAGARYSSSAIAFSNKTETVCMDNKVLEGEDLPAESYEEMEVSNPLPVPPKPQPKRAPQKPRTTPQKTDSTRYARSDNNPRPYVGGRPAQAAQPHVQMRGQQRQQRQPRPPSDPPEAIYECPDIDDENYS